MVRNTTYLTDTELYDMMEPGREYSTAELATQIAGPDADADTIRKTKYAVRWRLWKLVYGKRVMHTPHMEYKDRRMRRYNTFRRIE